LANFSSSIETKENYYKQLTLTHAAAWRLEIIHKNYDELKGEMCKNLPEAKLSVETASSAFLLLIALPWGQNSNLPWT
jgi:hypothetical protein